MKREDQGRSFGTGGSWGHCCWPVSGLTELSTVTHFKSQCDVTQIITVINQWRPEIGAEQLSLLCLCPRIWSSCPHPHNNALYLKFAELTWNRNFISYSPLLQVIISRNVPLSWNMTPRINCVLVRKEAVILGTTPYSFWDESIKEQVDTWSEYCFVFIHSWTAHNNNIFFLFENSFKLKYFCVELLNIL